MKKIQLDSDIFIDGTAYLAGDVAVVEDSVAKMLVKGKKAHLGAAAVKPAIATAVPGGKRAGRKNS